MIIAYCGYSAYDLHHVLRRSTGLKSLDLVYQGFDDFEIAHLNHAPLPGIVLPQLRRIAISIVDREMSKK